ncbi:MAG: ABC transporter permease [Gammaproteobacteria bacterium]|nr:ABC transporter permease [Gammaproteobacteria bacterium]MBU1465514.1 ABC transporter permease [Gammaproteobacteria bacterium]MBU2024993.1 ABC transporter permease [Gammaproteobacteria bacterium]MBU2237031.1 ABC transporter permease [Gammaproteobacteria bacterium]MBU2316995.1 ABC transporter permease [Gammaproteobacteria bacterium]
MKAMLLKRALQLITVVWGVGTLTFILMRSLPGDMAYRIAASRYGQDNVDSHAAALVREELKLDQGALTAYWHWLTDLLQFKLGDSLVSGLPVMDTVQHMLGHSLLLAFTGLMLSVMMAVPLGLLSAWRGNHLDSVLMGLSSVIRAMPVFVLGVLFILLFALHWNWFPVAGFGTPAHLVLPAITLALSLAAVSNRVVRDSAKRTFQAAFYQFSRVKGLSAWQTFRQHGVRNIAVPVVAFFGIQLVSMIEGIVMIESLFSWPGIGHGLAHAIFARDIPVIQGAALVMGILFVLLNTLVDVICLWIDPRGAKTL